MTQLIKATKPIIDTILNFTISKKLLVFFIATALQFTDNLEEESWVKIALLYIGTQGAVDLFKGIATIFVKKEQPKDEYYNFYKQD